MNTHLRELLPAPLDLGLERTRTFGRLTIRPAALEVEGGGRIVRVKPGCMRVLLAMIDAKGEVLTRDDLLARCWAGRIVTDSAINRCILEVRQALAAEPRAEVESIIKIGYRLRLHGEGAPASGDASPEEAITVPLRRRRWPWLVGAGAAAVVALVGAALLIGREEGAWTAEAMRPLTGDPGRETEPALTPDGRWLAYAAERQDRPSRTLMLRGVGQERAIPLTDPTVDAGFPAWSPDGRQVAFIRRTPEACEIWVAPALGGASRRVTRCIGAEVSRLTWSDDRTILFSDGPAVYAPQRLRALDVETGAVRDISDPPAGSRGDVEPLVSPDGKRVLFIRIIVHGVEDLHVGRLENGRIVDARPITHDGWKAPGAAWSADGKTVFYVSNKDGDRGLWAVRADRPNAEPQRLSLGVGAFGRLSSDGSNGLVAEVLRTRRNLVWLTGSGPTEISASTSIHWDPDITADGAVAYVSTETGSPEIWISEPGGRAARVTELRRSYLHGPRWSPDGQRLAFVSVTERETQLFLIGRQGEALTQLTRTPGDKREPAFARGGRSILFVNLQPRGGALVEVPLAGGPSRTLETLGFQWRSLKRGADGRLYGLKLDDQRLWRIADDLSRAEPLTDAPRIGWRDAWAVGPDALYLSRRRADGQSDLLRNGWSGGSSVVAVLPKADWAPTFALHPATGAILYERTVEDEADIVRLVLTRR
jgi:Tol biopolymer transport system component